MFCLAQVTRDCRSWRLRTAALGLIVFLMQVPLAVSQTSTKRVVQQVGIDQRLNQQLPLDLAFRDERGKAVTLRDYFHGKPVILTLVYYRCPMLCTQVLNGVLESSQAVSLTIGKDYDILSISIDPQETPAMAAKKKKRYVDSYYRPGAQTGWHFLTGRRSSIERLAKAVGFRYVHDATTNQYAHASGIFVLTPAGRISRYFYGIDYPPQDLRLGLVEASENRIGTVADQFLLLCYHYDPATGKYGFIIGNAIRAAGLATMLTLGCFLWLMMRHERRRTRREATRGTGDASGTHPPLPSDAGRLSGPHKTMPSLVDRPDLTTFKFRHQAGDWQ